MKVTRARTAIPVAFALSAFMLAASPEPQAALDSDCGANNGNLCWENQSCAWFIFFKQCTTKYRYYPGPSPTSEDLIS